MEDSPLYKDDFQERETFKELLTRLERIELALIDLERKIDRKDLNENFG